MLDEDNSNKWEESVLSANPRLQSVVSELLFLLQGSLILCIFLVNYNTA